MYGPLHVVWQVSFGCWIMWSISSWQNCYKSVFFPKAEQNFFFCLSTTKAWTFCKMNPLNPLRFTSHQKNWEKCLFFNLSKFWMIKLTKTPILPNCQVQNSFFGITANFIIQWDNFGKEDILITWSCQLEIDHVIQQPKETCQTTCRGPMIHYIHNIL